MVDPYDTAMTWTHQSGHDYWNAFPAPSCKPNPLKYAEPLEVHISI